jgi:hypothetical protein
MNFDAYSPKIVALLMGFISVSIISLLPAIAQEQVASLILATGFSQTAAMAIGYTGGAFSLASIANQDKYGNHCMGYGDPKPDHSMVLKNDFARLSLKIDSGGRDTTILIKGPDNDVRCAVGQKQIRDALIRDRNWKQGKYDIWVGSMQPIQRSPYRLSVEQ